MKKNITSFDDEEGEGDGDAEMADFIQDDDDYGMLTHQSPKLSLAIRLPIAAVFRRNYLTLSCRQKIYHREIFGET